MELVLHFVNKHYNPLESPQIKRYQMRVDDQSKLFLQILEVELSCSSKFYEAVKNQGKAQPQMKQTATTEDEENEG